MQTPRRQALLATLSGILAGITVLGVVVVIRGVTGPPQQIASTPPASTTPSSTPVSSANPDDALDADRLTFVRKNFGSGNTIDVPTGWRAEQSSDEQIRYVDPSGTWLFRADNREQKRKIAHMLASREHSLRRSPDFEVVSRDRGEVEGLTHRTLIYTYTNDSGTKRMVMSRWISAEGDGRSVLEITVGGRPRDEDGLAALLDKATQNLTLSAA